MTRSDLIARLTSRYPQLTARDVELAVGEILQGIQKMLRQGKRVEIRSFGSFSLRYRQPRKGRNPRTGDAVSVPGKCVPHFNASGSDRTVSV